MIACGYKEVSTLLTLCLPVPGVTKSQFKKWNKFHIAAQDSDWSESDVLSTAAAVIAAPW